MVGLAPTSPRAAAALLGWMELLADPTRLRLLRALERQELSVLELCEVLALPQSTVSRHLKALAGAGWVGARRRGTQSLHAWAPEPPAAARRLWAVARAETEGWPPAGQDARRLEAVLARRDGARRFFAGAAGAWDALRARAYGRGFGVEALLALLPPSWTVADLGCGTGALAAELSPRVRKVVAVDRSAAMLQAARRRTARLGNVELHEAELSALPLAAGSCDAALLVLVLAYLDDPDPALCEARRILRPGGRLVVLDAAAHADEELRRRMGQVHPGFEPEPLAARLRAAGLGGVTARALPPEPGARGPGLILCSGGVPQGRPPTSHPLPRRARCPNAA
jgi:SAM-dependent methyltransferase